MGLMRFLVADRTRLADDVLDRIFMTGIDEIPWLSRASWTGDMLVIERDVEDSGCVHVPWSVTGGGEPTLFTATLMERDEPYQLAVELARGSLNALRNQLANWQQAGLHAPASIQAQLTEATLLFGRAATGQHAPNEAAEVSHQVIDLAAQVSDRLGSCYTEQALSVRRRSNPKLATLLGVNLGHQPLDEKLSTQLAGAFNTAVLPLGWRRLETREGKHDFSVADQQVAWCLKQGFKICGGPLMQFDDGGAPDWTYLWEGDFDNLLGFMLEHLRAVVSRYKGKVHLWLVASRINAGKLLSLSEEQRLRIVVRQIEALRSIDPRTPIIVSFDQPWGEYLAKRSMDLTPIHFADTLVRADLGLAGLGLEINASYTPGGAHQYSLIDYSRQLDRWSLLGLPLMISLIAPSAAGSDVRSTTKALPIAGRLGPPLSPQSQADWVQHFVPLMLAKNCVQMVIWNQLRDQEPHDFPHGGLFDAQAQAKPALQTLRAMRRQYLA